MLLPYVPYVPYVYYVHYGPTSQTYPRQQK